MAQHQIGHFIGKVVTVVIEDIVSGGIESGCDILEKLHEHFFWDFSTAKGYNFRWLACLKVHIFFG